jgi:hypothetical protein
MSKPTKSSTKLDSPWKEMLELYFKEFMVFFFPKIHTTIDWKRGYEFLDKELQQVVRDAELGLRLADKLVKVWLKNGQEAILYIHIEIQGQFEEDFHKRMYVYNYRLFDRYGKPILSLAILGDNNEDWYPKHYEHEIAGCRTSFDFPIVKLWDYQDKWKKLEKSRNPFSIVVRTHLKGLETQRSPKKRLRWKIDLYKALYEEKYSEQKIRELFRFMDWVLGLPDSFALQFKDFVHEYEEKQKVPYITSIERMGIEQGRQEGHQEGIQIGIVQKSREDVIDILRVRFKRVPQTLVKTVQGIEDTSFLSKLLREAVLVESLKVFKQRVEKAV